MKHLTDVDKSYWEHLLHAWSVSGALLIHGVFPNLLEHYASDKICRHDTDNSEDTNIGR